MIDYDGLFDDYSFDILVYHLCFMNSSSVFRFWIYIVFFTHAYMVCFQCFRNLQINSFPIVVYSNN